MLSWIRIPEGRSGGSLIPSIPTPAKPEYFDSARSARAAGLSDAQLCALIHIFEADYPDDLMLRELHVLRACSAIVRGTTTIHIALERTEFATPTPQT